MGRRSATSWLIAILLVALGGMGFVRDAHASKHSTDPSLTHVCEADVADSSPASLPLDGGQPDEEEDCPTCDLLAVLTKSVAITSTPVTIDHAVLVRMIDAPAAADPLIADTLDDNRTRGPPAVSRCAV
jgi:hypothetical protein